MLARITFTTASLLSSLFVPPVVASAHTQRVHKPVSAVLRSRPVHRATRIVSPLVMRLTANVNRCEESGNWHVNGPTYFGGLGWLWATWQDWRQPSDPVNMAYATPEEQARAMARFIGHVNGGWWPDQPAGNCTGGY